LKKNIIQGSSTLRDNEDEEDQEFAGLLHSSEGQRIWQSIVIVCGQPLQQGRLNGLSVKALLLAVLSSGTNCQLASSFCFLLKTELFDIAYSKCEHPD